MSETGTPHAGELPYVDEHAAVIYADAQQTWRALLEVTEIGFSGANKARVAHMLGCVDRTSDGPRPLALGSRAPGFHVARADPGEQLALEGQHRFSRYSLVFRLEELDARRTRLVAETRAAFPGLKGSVYRMLVIGTRGHVVVVRAMLSGITRRAARHSSTDPNGAR